MKKLEEGLKPKDLDNLVLNEISIDEFESKIDTDAIVVGFFVSDKEPADDLSSFIETGMYGILDTEVSPGPNSDGNYLVFVEFLRDNDFPKKLKDILDSLKTLTGNKKWLFTYYGSHGKKSKFNVKEIKDKIRLKNDKFDESLNFFRESVLDNVSKKGKCIELRKNGRNRLYEKIALGDPGLIMHLLGISTKPLSLDSRSIRECNQLRRILGENWDVNKVDNYFILANNSDERIMVLK